MQQATGTAPPPLTNPGAPASTRSVVKVTGSQGNWGLTVNGAPYTIKGVTWGPAANSAAAYMPDVAVDGRQHDPHLGHRRHHPADL